MNNKKIGLAILILSALFALASFTTMTRYAKHTQDIGCVDQKDCTSFESVLNWSHLTVGLVFAAFSLGTYLVFFGSGETELNDAIKQLRAEKDKLATDYKLKLKQIKLNTVLSTLPGPEQIILKIISDNEGIAQNTLRLKANLSKAKVSQVLTDFRKRGIVVREAKGKTFILHLRAL